MTHELREARALCEEAHVLYGGRGVASGNPSDWERSPPSDEVARLLGIAPEEPAERVR